MRKFEIVVLKYGSLEIIQRYVIDSKDVDEARNTGITRHINPGNANKYFVGAQNI